MSHFEPKAIKKLGGKVKVPGWDTCLISTTGSFNTTKNTIMWFVAQAGKDSEDIAPGLHGYEAEYTKFNEELRVNNLWSRIVFAEPGTTLGSFSSVLQLLCAFYSAIHGHWELWKAGILHSDVSSSNILLTRACDSAEFLSSVGPELGTGSTGVLIDLDLNIQLGMGNHENNIRWGTRLYQSALVLAKNGWPHEFSDDLESFSLLLAWLCLQYEAPGLPRLAPPHILDFWSHPDPTACHYAKMAQMGSFDWYVAPEVSPELGRPILKLLGSLFKLLRGSWSAKRFQPRSPQSQCLATMELDANDFYKKFLWHVATAIEEQKLLDAKRLFKQSTMSQHPTNSHPASKATLAASPMTTAPSPFSHTHIPPFAPSGSNFTTDQKKRKREQAEVYELPKTPMKKRFRLSSSTLRRDDAEPSHIMSTPPSSPDLLSRSWVQPTSSPSRRILSRCRCKSTDRYCQGQRDR
ncbi:hypothetical protein BDN72DRAFT_962877 [Pluteus cervinus]|uniref:Uncharacterized protein n=1 Tax=Pluteus cervinus TaxID=181527 RepID=A0ACD3AHP0_9AGAR|nr:hypothetical protein BDN72DRAFT_962877 [Pluteus cervinus]